MKSLLLLAARVADHPTSTCPSGRIRTLSQGERGGFRGCPHVEAGWNLRGLSGTADDLLEGPGHRREPRREPAEAPGHGERGRAELLEFGEAGAEILGGREVLVREVVVRDVDRQFQPTGQGA